jgi:hypothetical protein
MGSIKNTMDQVASIHHKYEDLDVNLRESIANYNALMQGLIKKHSDLQTRLMNSAKEINAIRGDAIKATGLVDEYIRSAQADREELKKAKQAVADVPEAAKAMDVEIDKYDIAVQQFVEVGKMLKEVITEVNK